MNASYPTRTLLDDLNSALEKVKELEEENKKLRLQIDRLQDLLAGDE
jgi:regulator of replication initiation timing